MDQFSDSYLRHLLETFKGLMEWEKLNFWRYVGLKDGGGVEVGDFEVSDETMLNAITGSFSYQF